MIPFRFDDVSLVYLIPFSPLKIRVRAYLYILHVYILSVGCCFFELDCGLMTLMKTESLFDRFLRY